MNRGSEPQRRNSSEGRSQSGSLHRMESDFIKEHDMSRGYRESELNRNLNAAYTPLQSNYTKNQSYGIDITRGRNDDTDAIPRTLETALHPNSYHLDQGTRSQRNLKQTAGTKENSDISAAQNVLKRGE